MKENNEYPRGATVHFKVTGLEIKDVNSNSKIPHWEGTINGNPICDEKNTPIYIPVWCERENREPTTVMVAVSNILSVKKNS